MCVLALPVSICHRLAWVTGLLGLLRGLTNTLVGWIDPQQAQADVKVLPRTRTLRLLREGAARGGLTGLQRDLIDRVMRISRTRVAQVMIRHERVALVSLELPRVDLLRIIRMAHFSRLPVHDGDPRRIVGIVNVYDVLTDPEQKPLQGHLQSTFRLPPGTSVSAALMRMQRARQTMAIVQDKQGKCLGILTIKDLVQEIIGDIEAW